MLKQQFHLKQEQRLSPLQIQVIKMLELPVLELEERIRQELIDNPALEYESRGEESYEMEAEDRQEEGKEKEQEEKQELLEWAWDDGDSYEPSVNMRSHNNSSEPIYFREAMSSDSFLESLRQQLDAVNITEKVKTIADYVIGNIESDGYLRRGDDQMIDDMLMHYGVDVSEAEMKAAIKAVQNLDPPGVGARNLQECLLLQLMSQNKESDNQNAKEIISKYFTLLDKGAYETISKKMKLTEVEMKSALEQIKRLNPKPGSMYGAGLETLSQVIAPDFKVENINGDLVVELLTANVAELKITHEYKRMLKNYEVKQKQQSKQDKETFDFLRQKVESARNFIDAIKQRNTTLLSTMKAIVDLQKDFFLTGDDYYLKPMKLKDVSDIVGNDISTISRVNNSKYVETEWGIYSLKHFFSESMQTAQGESVSNKEIKQTIRDVIALEDKKNPIADEELMNILNNKGYVIARRTVAKYREQMNIPVARIRKIKV